MSDESDKSLAQLVGAAPILPWSAAHAERLEQWIDRLEGHYSAHPLRGLLGASYDPKAWEDVDAQVLRVLKAMRRPQGALLP